MQKDSVILFSLGVCISDGYDPYPNIWSIGLLVL
jgi:hypothetical protein